MDDLGPEGFLEALRGLEYNNYHSINQQIENSNFFKLYKANIRNSNYSIVEDIGTKLANFSSDRCLTVINNFRGVDIPSFDYTPVMLRKFNLAILTHSPGHIWYNPNMYSELIWAPSKMSYVTNGSFEVPENILYSKHIHFCPTSVLYNPIIVDIGTTNRELCVVLNINAFIRVSKPWQCQVQVDMFPPNHLLYEERLTHIFHDSEKLPFRFIPSTIPQINILVRLSLDYYEAENLHAWIQRMGRHQSYTPTDNFNYWIVTDIFFLTLTVCHFRSLQVACHIQSMDILRSCDYCQSGLKKIPLHLNKLSVEYMVNEVTENREDQDVWNIGEYFLDYDTLIRKITYYMRLAVGRHRSYTLRELLSLKKLSKFENSVQDRLAMILASYMMNILGNVSKPIAHKFPYEKRYWISYDVTRNPNTAIQITDNLSSLKFITCKSRGLSSFPFEEFWKVFDNNVWVWMFIALLLLLVGIMRLSGRRFFTSTFWSGSKVLYLIKVLMEQSNPFPESLIKQLKFRFLIAGTLLAGVVLSNAYKSTNVYNILKARHVVPYENVDELFHDNFTIYSRVVKLYYFIFSDEVNWIKKLTKLQISTTNANYGIVLDSPLNISQHFSGNTEARDLYERNLKHIGSAKYFTSFKYNKTLEVLKAGVHHPNVIKFILEPANIMVPLDRIGYIKHDVDFVWEEAFGENFLDKQNTLMLTDLKQCNEKSVWVLPQHLASIYSRLLGKNKSYSHVGSEMFATRRLNIYMTGLVPIWVLKRISVAFNSGILDWMETFVEISGTRVNVNAVAPSKPNMEGNILVVFVILGLGLLGAFFLFFLEIRAKVFRFAYNWFIILARQLCIHKQVLKLVKLIKSKMCGEIRQL